MINFFNKLSFTKKLILVNILVILPVLIIGTIVSIIFINNNEKHVLKEQIAAISQLTASYSTADILFADSEGVNETLKNLNVFPSIVYACVLNNDNQVIATYGKEQENFGVAELISNPTIRYTEGQLIHYKSIYYNNESLGQLVIISDTLHLKQLLRHLYIGIIIGSFIAFCGVLIMSSRLQYLITKPILNLVQTIEEVVKTENYRLRIKENPYKDEIGTLNIDFNSLMDTIELTTVSKNYLDNIMDSLAEMLIVLDETGRIITINKAITAVTGYELGDLLGELPEYIFNKEFAQNIFDQKVIETLLKNNNGQTIFVSVSITSFVNKEGFERTILSIRDISKQKESEIAINEYYEKLERTNKELEKLSYITSHDLKAPLRAVGSLVTMIEEDINDDAVSEEVIDEYFMLMRKRINRMDGLINGILEYSKIGRERVENKSIDLNNLITEVIETIVPNHFQVTQTPNLPTLTFNQTQVYQVFQNLIGNAVKYNDKPIGKINILYQDLGNRHQFRIEDNGVGISKKYHEKVFEVFQMLEARDKVESTGIGLSIVKKIIEQSGGKIWIDSDIEEGVAFVFELPK